MCVVSYPYDGFQIQTNFFCKESNNQQATIAYTSILKVENNCCNSLMPQILNLEQVT